MVVAVPEQTLQKLNDVASKAPENAVKAVTSVLEVVRGQEEKGAFAAQLLHAIARLAEHADRKSIVAALGAPSPYAALYQLLEHPEALADLRALDPLLPARIRGLRARERLLAAEGGSYSTAQVAEVLGISRQAVDNRRKNGKLIGVSLGKRGYVYPAWQFGLGETLAGLDVVLAALGKGSAWSQLSFMLNGNSWLDGDSPLDRLRRGDVEAVRGAALMNGQQAAA